MKSGQRGLFGGVSEVPLSDFFNWKLQKTSPPAGNVDVLLNHIHPLFNIFAAEYVKLLDFIS